MAVAKKKKLSIDEQFDLIIAKAKAYEAIKADVNTFPYRNLLELTTVSNSVNTKDTTATLKYTVPFLLTDSKLITHDYYSPKIVPIDATVMHVCHRITVTFKITYSLAKEKLKYKFDWIGVDRDNMVYGEDYVDFDEVSVYQVLCGLIGYKATAYNKSVVKRKTDDAEFFKGAMKDIIDVIKEDNIIKAQILVHNLTMDKSISLLK